MKKKIGSQPKELKELKKVWESLKKSIDRAEKEMKRVGEKIKAGKLPTSTQLLKNIVNTAKSQLKKVNNLSAKAKKAGLSVKEPVEKQVVSITKKLDAIASKLPELAKKAATKKPVPKKMKPAKPAVAKPKVEKKPPAEELAAKPEVKPSEPEAPPPPEAPAPIEEKPED